MWSSRLGQFALCGCLIAVVFDSAVLGEDDASVERRLLDAVRYLSSDELEGRGVGTAGLEEAAEYIAKEFEALGVTTSLFDGSPFQPFDVTMSPELGPEEMNKLIFLGPESESAEIASRVELKLVEEFQPLALGGSAKVTGPLVFVGYGITAEDEGYDDYADIDVRGKVVLMLRKEPQQSDANSVFDGKEHSRHALFNTKIENAARHGAAAVIFVNDHYGVVESAEAARRRWSEAIEELVEAHSDFKAIEGPSVAQVENYREKVRGLVDTIQKLDDQLRGKHDELLTLDGAGIDERPPDLAVFFARRSAIDPIVKSATGKDLAQLESALDELTPQSQPLEGWTAECESNIVLQKTTIKNVAGVLEGEGPLANETIVVGAHYDHLGNGGPGSLAPWTRDIHNGADDNASGTTTLLEVARRIATRDSKPARRIVFIAFAGEERGLLGSKHYIANPAIPLEDTIAMVNLDMVGRLNENKLFISGTGTAKSFDALIDELNEEYAFELNKDPGGHGPSDHQSFYTAKVPVFHFYTGTHNDYHRPSDDYDKINIAGMRRVGEMVADVVMQLADVPSRPEYVEVKRRRRGPGGQRPYLGSMPDMNRDVEGYALLGVAKDGPAEKAGLKAGDVIIRFGDSKIGGFDDIDAALRRRKAGDQVKLLYLREGQELETTVTLEAPK